MAHFNIKFYSNCLNRPVPLEVIIPNDPRADFEGKIPIVDKKNMKCIFLLHGYTGDGGNWIPEHLLAKYNAAVVCPSCENSFYLDGISTAHKFQTFVGEELVNFIRDTFGLALTPEKTFTMGMSMGGFGALHTALAYPKTFGKCVGLSSALIVHGIAHMKPEDKNPVANYEYYRECFGDLETVEERDVNPEVLATKLKSSGETLPKIYMACGTEDFLLEPNRAMHRFLTETGIDHVYLEDKGNHDMDFWSHCVPACMEWLCN
ncbi:MAG: alpha/beta fold hydrolase [Treponema sp.]|nr:alpha/beta fold hydrolase [Treponema sp.]